MTCVTKKDAAIAPKSQTEAQRKQVRFGKEEQQRKRTLTFEKSRSKRYTACSDVEHRNTIDAEVATLIALTLIRMLQDNMFVII